MLRVGCVSYINALPLHFPLTSGCIPTPVQFVFDIPRVLNTHLREKKLDLALSSCVEYLDGDYQLFPGYGIVGHHQVLSVNLYSRKPLHQLSGCRVGLTHHSAASISLLKVLCHHHWKITPCFEPLNRQEPFSNYDAILLIGDEALVQLTLPGFETIDLAAAWYELTAFPFVFALFSVRHETSSAELVKLQNSLENALEWSASHPHEIIQEAMGRCPLSQDLVQQYYSVLRYRLGPQEMESLNLFKKLREDVPKIGP